MLDLNDLDTDDIPGVGRERGVDLAKAGAVCLESQGHNQGVQLAVRGTSENRYTLTWPDTTAQDRRTWADPSEATEDGAAGIAALLAIREIGYTVILRSYKSTGIDYRLGSNDQSDVTTAERAMTFALQPLLEDDDLIVKGRMEVSGILNGDDQQISARTRLKLRQTDQSDSSALPAYVMVVEFGQPVAEVTRK